MAEAAPHIPEDDIEAVAQQSVQDENAPADRDTYSHSDVPLNKLPYEQRLYVYVNSCVTLEFQEAFLDFRHLSQMNIVHLMNELAKYEKARMKNKTAPQDIERLGDLLHRYTTAVQDREYWSKLSKLKNVWETSYRDELLLKGFEEIYRNCQHVKLAYLGEFFKPTSGSKIDPLRDFLNKVLPSRLTWNEDERAHRYYKDYRAGKPPQELSPFVDTLARFIVAITGGLALVVPMLVMRLGETLAKSLTTVSVAVVLFSALTSLMFKASNVETLGATAAYAAVLVVFVGASH